MKKSNNVFLIILMVAIVVLVFLFPTIYNYIETAKLPKLKSDNSQVDENKNKKVEDDILDSLHYPLMRNSIYNSNTYYTLDKFTYANMSNQDIMYNAFLDIYDGNMTTYNGSVSCTNESKQFNQDYIQLRIKNIIGKDVNYILESFEVPIDSSSNYKGFWIYDQANNRFIYNGLCNKETGGATYYNLEQYIKSTYDKSNILVYKYVGFAKVEGENYTIYSDAAMNNIIDSGTTTDITKLNSIFANINKKDKKIYKYIFKDTLCSYNEYCLYEGEWTNEL